MISGVELLPILDDNYVFFFKEGTDVCLVDPGDAGPCLDFLSKNKLNLTNILITHHHHRDHIDGIESLKKKFSDLKVYAPFKNKNQIPAIDFFVQDQQKINITSNEFQVIELPGHTLGIVGYYNAKKKWLFSGDVLFGLGCGRLFEGTPEMAYSSLKKISVLPKSTIIFCTHEYTMQNLQFVEKLITQKKTPKGFDFDFFEIYKKRLLSLRAQNKASVPLYLADELKINPFLLSAVHADASIFAALREERDYFRPKY